MKKIFLFIIFAYCSNAVMAQNFNKDLATAQSSYTANKLDDAHFALQQALLEVDIITGKQVLKFLPTQMGTLTANTKDDNVFSNVGFVGATIHRTWGTVNQMVSLDVIDNSPLITTLNTFLNMPFGSLMNSSTSKMEKVQGYKGRLNTDGEGSVAGTSNYTLQLPLSTALLTFTVSNTSDSQVLNYANALPLSQMAKLIQ